jgi:predicted glycogen debranching enzyme
MNHEATLELIPAAPHEAALEPLLDREWLVTNGLGGYASGTVAGVATRRYHGLLIAALPAPIGRTVTLCQLWERLRLPDGRVVRLGGLERAGRPPEIPGAGHLAEFRLESGLPIWLYEIGPWRLEKRIVLPHRQNTVHVIYRLEGRLEGAGPPARLELEPTVCFRGHELPVSVPLHHPYELRVVDERYELFMVPDLPPLRLLPHGAEPTFTVTARQRVALHYRIEQRRGYESEGEAWRPGVFALDLAPGGTAALTASTEPWEVVTALSPAEAEAAERVRRDRLVARADPRLLAADLPGDETVGADLVLAADQFIITPGRAGDAAFAHAAGDEPRTVIAGYHWFTDWGRDTMISLEGLTVPTGRLDEARYILRTFAHHVRDGLIPNLFPEGNREGLYHTADATLWFFHATERYLRASGDRGTLEHLLPVFLDIAEHHLRGTRFGIGVDPADGLLHQGAEGYQLTWMDAKVDGWVVTPRRGKAVEINALWYNALRLLGDWFVAVGGTDDPAVPLLARAAEQARESFNRRFWYAEGGYLYDVVDGEQGDDPACRPNQIFALSLDHPVLDRARWERVVAVVEERLLTPLGLRSLAPGHPDYKARYNGDLRSRDAAYHQGTVWGWLIGPFVDAWRRVHPEDPAARRFLAGFLPHLRECGVGSISEIFDAEPPWHPRGCIAQAWSVAEVLRCWHETVRSSGQTAARSSAKSSDQIAGPAAVSPVDRAPSSGTE